MAPTALNNRRYLCQAPRPDAWEDYADEVLKNLGKTPEKRRAALEQTLKLAKQRNPFTPKIGPGRKTNTEHAIGFYEYLMEKLDENKEKHDDEEAEENKEEKEGNEKKAQEEQEEEEDDDDDNEDEEKAPEPEGDESTTRSLDTQEFNAQHNDVCDVCDGTGELLMCSTCNLVFHLSCTRPIMTELPTDKNWRCSYCVLSTEPKNSKPRRQAAAAVRMMARLRNKFRRNRIAQVKDEEESGGEGADEKKDKQNEGEKPTEKSETKEEAKEGEQEKKPIAVVISGSPDRGTKRPSTSSPEDRRKRARKQPTLYNPQSGPAREWQSDKNGDMKAPGKRNEDSTSDGDSDSDRKPSPRKGARGGNNTWCGFCGDDPSIKVCCFCACRVCFGKHHQSKLLLCDRCDDEFHTFCLDPPLTNVPKKKWYCPNCTATEEKRTVRSRNESRTPSPRRASTRQVVAPKVEDPPKRSRSAEKSKSGGNAQGHIPGSADQPRTKSGRFAPFPPSVAKAKATAKKRAREESSSSRGRPKSTASSARKSTGRPVGRPPSTGRPVGRPPSTGRPVGRPPSTGRPVGRPPSSSRTSTGRPVGRPPSSGRTAGRPSSTGRPVGRPPSSGRKSTGRPVGRPPSSGRGRPASTGRPVGRPPSKRREEEASARAKAAKEETLQMKLAAAAEPVKVSRSGRTVKRSTFHDEIGEGEQHLRVSRQESSASDKASAQEESKPGPAEETTTTRAPQKEVSATKEQSESQAVAQAPVLTPPPPSEKPAPTGPPGNIPMAPSTTSKVPPAAFTSPVAASGPSTTPPASAPPRVASQDTDKEGVKVPRRKPGARECMQISRRFGVEVIPDKYMDILLDYCKRGKVEHLIRMRERLDDHARFLESQLAGLEALVLERGEVGTKEEARPA